MKKLKLEVGKRYLDRSGRVVTITDYHGSSTYPFNGDNLCTYTPDGREWEGAESKLDLICEAAEKAGSVIQLEVGKIYIARNGEVVEIVSEEKHYRYPFIGDNGRTYLPTGEFSANETDTPFDLVTETLANRCLKLEVGKSYINGSGDIVTIVLDDRVGDFRFHGNNSCTYTSAGLFSTHPDSYIANLIAEAPPEQSASKKAGDYLHHAAEIMAERGKQYDSPEGERSMGKTVEAFNTITGQDMTEAQGWLFMSVLKKVRQYQGKPHLDSCEDDVAYAALFAEARMAESKV